MAYSLRLPLFVIREESVRDEGLLERGYDWMVATADPATDPSAHPELMAHLESWTLACKRKAGWFPYSSLRRPIGVRVDNKMAVDTSLAT